MATSITTGAASLPALVLLSTALWGSSGPGVETVVIGSAAEAVDAIFVDTSIDSFTTLVRLSGEEFSIGLTSSSAVVEFDVGAVEESDGGGPAGETGGGDIAGGDATGQNVHERHLQRLRSAHSKLT
jgi:hypothetical protein